MRSWRGAGRAMVIVPRVTAWGHDGGGSTRSADTCRNGCSAWQALTPAVPEIPRLGFRHVMVHDGTRAEHRLARRQGDVILRGADGTRLPRQEHGRERLLLVVVRAGALDQATAPELQPVPVDVL